MGETARERAAKGAGVTDEMVGLAEGLLRELGIDRLSKKFSNRDVLYEILRAALFIRKDVQEDVLVRDEEEWARYFEKCMVIVREPEVGKQLLKIGTESAEAFGAIVDTIAQNKGLVVPLEKYPGVSLFKKHVANRKGKSVSDETAPS